MQARITFYKIYRCGLYVRSRNGGALQPKFLNTKELLADLSQWAIGKTLANTNVLRNSQNQGFCTYLADIKSNTDSTILVMWNQVPHTDADSIMADSIPRYPTYFWFIPSLNVFATICFSTIVNGRTAMEIYIKQFMKL